VNVGRDSEKNAFEIIEESFHLVRLAPLPALAAYYIGTLPFVLAFLYFWSDMARSAFAEQRLLTGVLGLTALFAWMKAWQSIYCGQLLAKLCGETNASTGTGWSVRTLVRAAVFQAIVQPAGLFVILLSAAVLFPFGWAYAFFSTATVINGTHPPDLRTVFRRTGRQTALWPRQNHYVLMLMLIFGSFVLLNMMTALLAGPHIVKMLLGIESVFTQSPWAAMNSTLLMAQLGLTYLCLDPVMKAAYVLRCFYGESLHTGQDLRADLAGLRQARAARPGRFAALLLACGLVLTIQPVSVGGVPAPAAEPAARSKAAPLSTERLERSIDDTIQKREFSWRLPPEEKKDGVVDSDSWLARASRQLEQSVKALCRWLEEMVKSIRDQLRSKPSPAGTTGPGFANAMEVAIILLIALLLGAILWLLVRLWQKRPRLDPAAAVATPAQPDLNREEVSADELPEDGWLRLAREHQDRGELRLALRGYYLAGLSHLGERQLITLVRSKSNGDYAGELRRRAHALGSLPDLFSENLTAFERVWYGEHPATPELLGQATANLQQMKSAA
jgi:hypothetical protein